jgi:OFA family oxalate/formate antiporter-like MFS transporter
MNLAFGNIYGWSVFVAPLEKQFGWKRVDTSLVFTIAVFMTGITFLLSGWIYDRWGPRFCAFTSGIMASLGFFLSAYTHSLHYLFACFGVVGGFGAGLGCAVIIPTMAKWFPGRRGLAIGLTSAAYGGSSAIFGYLAANRLIPDYGLPKTFQLLGLVFFAMTMVGAFLLKDPPSDYRPGGLPATSAQTAQTGRQFSPTEALRTAPFQFVWLGYAFGAASGMMVISQLVPFATSRGISTTQVASEALVAGAIGNALGRAVSGWLSDALERLNVLRLMVAVSVVAMPMLYSAGGNIWTLCAVVLVVYFCYGTLLSVNPALSVDFWGIKNAGVINGMMFTAWGTAGILGPYIAGTLYDRYHNYRSAFYAASLLGAVALTCELLAKRPSAVTDKEPPETLETGISAGKVEIT